MASIRTQIELYDSISAPLYNITSALNMTISAFEDMQDSANNSFDSSNFEGARDHINAATIEIEEMVQNINEAGQQQQNLNDSLNEGTIAAGGLESKLLKIVATYATMKTANAVLNISDTMVETTARLNLMNDGLQTTKDLQNMIYLSAQNSRSEYQATADMVSQLGLNAKDAFSSNVELIRFAEQLNKSMVIAGASGMAAESTIYNLTQALSTGVLRGQDLNAVLSNSPNIVQNIADYLDVPIGKIKDMAADGQITAEIVKNAMLAATDATNAAFESMPMTFGQIATSIKNDALMAFEPVLARLNEIANSEQFQVMVDGIITSMVFVAGVVIEIFDLVGQVGSFIAENWSILEPIILGVATALGIYTLALIAYNTVQGITNIIKGIATLQANIHAAGLMMETGATFAATAAQHGFNAALLACPLTWIILAIIAIIAIIYMAVAAFNKFAGTSVSATGIIVGVLAVAAAFVGNLFLGLLDLVLGIINALINPFIEIANFIGNVFTSPISSIIYLFQGMADGVLAVLQKIASAMDFIFGSNMADTVGGWRSGLKDMADAAVAEYAPDENYQKVMDNLDLSAEGLGLKRWAYGDAWDAGYSFGEGIEDTISNFDIGSIFDSNIPDPSDYANGYDASTIPGNVASTADNTGKIKDAVDISQEDLKYMRDLAEMETVNRYTTAEIKVDMVNHNTINNEMDLDGVVDYLGEGVNEAMEKAAEGVHD